MTLCKYSPETFRLIQPSYRISGDCLPRLSDLVSRMRIAEAERPTVHIDISPFGKYSFIIYP